MEINNLWQELTPDAQNFETIKLDMSRGVAPNLPYFVIGMEDVRHKIGAQLNTIDRNFQYSILQADYGNGKSNLLKYLEYFFKSNEEYNVHVEYWRADVERVDIKMFLLYILQVKYLNHLVVALETVAANGIESLRKCANNYEDSFSILQEYVEKIFSCIDVKENLTNLIWLGTGKLYSKSSFDKMGLTPLTNYNRLEVLVFFLNVLASNKCYIVFAIDELEKIQEKSRARFNNFLTSFRELIDISSLIKGHFLICAITQAAGVSGQSLLSYNPAFLRRASSVIYELKTITELDLIQEWVRCTDMIIKTEKSSVQLNKIANTVFTKYLSRNSEIQQAICASLTCSLDYKSLKDLLTEKGLINLFKTTKGDISAQIGTNILPKMLSLLDIYMRVNYYAKSDFEIKVQQGNYMVDYKTKRVQIFASNSQRYDVMSKIESVMTGLAGFSLVLYRPEELDLSATDLPDGIDVIPYSSLDLMTLLQMFTDDTDNTDIKEIIHLYTRNNL